MRNLISVLGLAVLLATSLARAARGEIPEVLYRMDEAPYPAWVSAERTLAPDGTVDPELFSETSRSGVARILATPPHKDCIHRGLLVCGFQADLAEDVRKSDWVFTATITARGGGFSAGSPGTLLEVVPTEVFKGPSQRVWEHYIFMPIGTFLVGDLKLCQSAFPYADLPEVGEEVLLLIDLTRSNQHSSNFLDTSLERIITLHSNGETSLPGRYRKKNKALMGSSRSEIIRFVQQVLEEN